MPAPSTPSGLSILSSFIPRSGPSINKAVLVAGFTPTASTQTRVEWSSDAGTTWQPGTVAAVGATSAQVGKLALGIAHLVRIRAEDAGGASAWVTLGAAYTTGTLATAASPPAAPTGLTIDDVGTASVELSWTDGAKNEDHTELTFATAGVTRRVIVPAPATSAAINLYDLFAGALGIAAANPQFYAVYARAGGGAAPAAAIYSTATDTEVFGTEGTPVIILTLPSMVTAWRGIAFSLGVTTLTSVDDIDATGLPDGLAVTFSGPADSATIEGTVTDEVGDYAVTITATDGSDTADREITIRVSEPRVEIAEIAPVTAPLGVLFAQQLHAVGIGPVGAITWSQEGAPSWLSLSSGGAWSGTPDEVGTWAFVVTAEAGDYSAVVAVTVTAPTVSITSAAEGSAFVGQRWTFNVTTNSAAAVVTVEGQPAWLSIGATGVLSGIPAELGTVGFTLVATLGGEVTVQAFTLTVGSIITGPESVSITTGIAVKAGPWAYLGNGSALTWALEGGPEGLSMDNSIGGEPSIAFMVGTTSAAGIYQAQVCVYAGDGSGGGTAKYSVPVALYVSGGLFIAEVHADPTLYDLQVQTRGDAASRTMTSFYGRQATLPATAVKEDGDTTVTTLIPGQSANLLTLKQGDDARLAIVMRDGSEIVSEGISDVVFAMRLGDSEDGDYLFVAQAEAVEIGEHTYFLCAFPVADDFLADFMGEPGVGSVSVLGEVSWTYTPEGGDPMALSSATAPMTVVDEVYQ